MRKLMIAVLGAGLVLGLACQTERKGAKVSAAVPGEQTGSIAAESFFQFSLERLELDNEVTAGFLELLKAAGQYDQDLENNIYNFEKQTVPKYQALREKHKTSFAAVGKMERDESLRPYLDGYLDRHPEIKKSLADREQEKVRLENALSVEMSRLHPSPQPEPLLGQASEQ